MRFNYSYINSDEYKKAIPFSKYIIEYFKNDYKMIKDFLTNNSPWDLVIEWKLSLTHDELIEKKILMYNVINNTYSKCFLNNLSESEYEKIILEDKSIEYILEHKRYIIQLFSENLDFAIKIIKFYIETLKIQTNIKECTYNKYKYDIENVIGIYNMEYMKTGMDDELSDEENAINFFNITNYKIKRYIKRNFKFENEGKNFINYIISLSYAYLKYLENEYDDEILEEEIDFLKAVEKLDDLNNLFDENDKFFTIAFETLSSCLLEYRQSYDLRKKIDDNKSIEIFKKLDKNYDTIFLDDIVIEDYTIDILFERIINDFIKDLNNDQIFDLLTDEISIYSDLFKNGLDPRYEKKYKLLIMRKIITNSYEYLLYLYRNKDERIDINVNLNDVKLPIKDDNVFSYFCNNYNDILNMYREYNKKTLNFHEKNRIDIYNGNSNDIIKMKKTYFYIEGRYIGIIHGLVKQLDSVDYINDIYLKINRDYKLELNGIKEIEKYYKTICFYVYERLVNIKDCPEYLKNEIQNIIKIISSINNFSDEFINSKENFEKINLWFINLSMRELSYYEELKLRKKIENPEHIKVLNRLNEFNEYIKKEKK